MEVRGVVMKDEKYATDNGNGMKFVAVIILFSMLAFMGGLFISWVGDTYMHPTWSAASPRSHSP